MNSGKWDKDELGRTLSDPCLHQAERCPFCHASRLGLVSDSKGLAGAKRWRVRCSNCLSYGPWHVSPEAAVQFWNGKHARSTSGLFNEFGRNE